MKSWPKVKLGQVQVGSNIAQNHSKLGHVDFGHNMHKWEDIAY